MSRASTSRFSAFLDGCRGATAKAVLATFVVGACLHTNPAHALDPMDDTEMGSVTGQEGILVSLDYYYNSKPLYKDDGTIRAEGKGPDDLGAANADCTGLASVNCRLALQMENRGFGWLVFKNGYASLEMNRLSLDASTLGGDPVAENGVSSANKAITFNLQKFQDEASNCLLGAGNCTTAYIDNMPGVRAHYPQSGGSYTADTVNGGGSIAGYNDVLLGLHVEGLAVEYNVPDGAETWTAQPGWQSDNFGSFMGLEIADNAGHQAGIAIGGNFYMYGF